MSMTEKENESEKRKELSDKLIYSEKRIIVNYDLNKFNNFKVLCGDEYGAFHISDWEIEIIERRTSKSLSEINWIPDGFVVKFD